jgi:hypothetical protein
MSLYENINKRKKAGTSRSKSKSTISASAYANMKKGFPKKMGGLSMKYMMAGMKKYFKGGFGKLKDIPSNNKGLPKLSKSVRNNMGYKKNGGRK